MTSKIKVLMLSQYYWRGSLGGAERQIISLAPYMQKSAIEIHMIARRQNSNIPQNEDMDGVFVYRTPVFRFGALTAIAYILFTLWKIRQIKPDIIHAYGLFSTTSAAMFARKIYQIPVVAKVLRGGILGDVIRIKAKLFGQRRMDLLTHNVDGFVAISDEIIQELTLEGVAQNRCHYIPNGVDISRFYPITREAKGKQRQTLGLPVDQTIVIFVGRLVPAKRVNLLLSAWGKISQRHDHAHLYIVGEGKDKEKLQAMAGEHVTFAGYQSNIAQWLQVADLYILPSVAEGLSNSLLEAMATALPIIVTAVGDAPKLIDKNRGWCIPPDDEDAIYQSLDEALTYLENARKMGKNSRKMIEEQYQLSATAKQLRHLYEEVIQAGESR